MIDSSSCVFLFLCVSACVCALPKAAVLEEYMKEIRTMNRCSSCARVYVLKCKEERNFV